MKVILDGTGVSNKPTGLGVYVFHLVKGICTISTDFKFELWVSDSLNKHHRIFTLNYPNLTIETISVKSIGPIRDLVFNRYRRRVSKDILFHSLSSNYPLTIFPFKKSIATVLDLKFIFYPNFLGNLSRLKSYYLAREFRIGVKRADKIICISESTKNDLLAFSGNDNLYNQKISVIPLASAFEKGIEVDTESGKNKLFQNPYFLRPKIFKLFCTTENQT